MFALTIFRQLLPYFLYSLGTVSFQQNISLYEMVSILYLHCQDVFNLDQSSLHVGLTFVVNKTKFVLSLILGEEHQLKGEK